MPIPRIGRAGIPWGDSEKQQWRALQTRQRSHAADVVEPLERAGGATRYGEVVSGSDRYPLLAWQPRPLREGLPTALITGGVHGYETSGVHGALQFLGSHAGAYLERVNLIVVPCVSPWAYEHVQRWNAEAIDPNRSFTEAGRAQEAAALMRFIAPLRARVTLHVDLHETTDTDESEFRPLLSARDGKAHAPGTIPDGFYLVGDTENPQPAFQMAVIEAVARATHIAPADAKGEIIGSPVVARGVIHYAARKLGLCMGMTAATYATTTEVYPDSPRASAAQCNAAQIAAVCGALDFVLAATAAPTN